MGLIQKLAGKQLWLQYQTPQIEYLENKSWGFFPWC